MMSRLMSQGCQKFVFQELNELNNHADFLDLEVDYQHISSSENGNFLIPSFRLSQAESGGSGRGKVTQIKKGGAFALSSS